MSVNGSAGSKRPAAAYTAGDWGRGALNAFDFLNVGPTTPMVPSFQQSIAQGQGTPMPSMGALGRLFFPNSGVFSGGANQNLNNLGLNNMSQWQSIGHALGFSPVTGNGPLQGLAALLGNFGKATNMLNPLNLVGALGRYLAQRQAQNVLNAPGTNAGVANQYTNAWGTPTNNNRGALGAMGLMGSGWGSVGATGTGTGGIGDGSGSGASGGFGGTGLGASFNRGNSLGALNGLGSFGSMGGGWGGGGVGSDNFGGGNWSSFGSGLGGGFGDSDPGRGDISGRSGGMYAGTSGGGGGYSGGGNGNVAGSASINNFGSSYVNSSSNVGGALSAFGGNNPAGSGGAFDVYKYAVK